MTASAPLNLAPVDPGLKDLLDAHKRDILLNLACHHLGTLKSFDDSKQTGKATVNYPQTYYQLDPGTGLYEPKQVDYPVLVDCPFIVLGGGKASLTFPFKAGDECLVLFNDRDMDNWFKGGAGAPVASGRLHSFSDGIILVGIRSKGNVLSSYDMDRAVLQNGTTMVGVGASKLRLKNDSKNLMGVLEGMLDLLGDLVTDLSTTASILSGASIEPAAAAAGAQLTTATAALSPQITMYKTSDIEGLLE